MRISTGHTSFNSHYSAKKKIITLKNSWSITIENSVRSSTKKSYINYIEIFYVDRQLRHNQYLILRDSMQRIYHFLGNCDLKRICTVWTVFCAQLNHMQYRYILQGKVVWIGIFFACCFATLIKYHLYTCILILFSCNNIHMFALLWQGMCSANLNRWAVEKHLLA